VPGQDEELTFNHDGRTYELGTGYGHIALAVDDLDETLARHGSRGSSLGGSHGCQEAMNSWSGHPPEERCVARALRGQGSGRVLSFGVGATPSTGRDR